MELMDWQPLGELVQLRQRLNRLLEQHFYSLEHRPPHQSMEWMPPIELMETDTEMHLKLMLPGVNPHNIDIRADQHSISVAGYLHEVSRTKDREDIRSEFYVGRFQRIVPLPTAICPDLVKATYVNGILSLILPKVEVNQRQRVKVTVQAKVREAAVEQRQHEEHLKETMRKRTSAELDQALVESIPNIAREAETRQRQSEQHFEETMHIRADAEVRKGSEAV